MRSNTDIERGKELKDARLRRGLSRPEVARRLGVHRNSVLGWEKGRLPYDGHAEGLIELYDLPYDFFARGDTMKVDSTALTELAELIAALDARTRAMAAQIDSLTQGVEKPAEKKRSPIDTPAPPMPAFSDEEPEDIRKRGTGD